MRCDWIRGIRLTRASRVDRDRFVSFFHRHVLTVGFLDNFNRVLPSILTVWLNTQWRDYCLFALDPDPSKTGRATGLQVSQIFLFIFSKCFLRLMRRRDALSLRRGARGQAVARAGGGGDGRGVDSLRPEPGSLALARRRRRARAPRHVSHLSSTAQHVSEERPRVSHRRGRQRARG